MRWVAARKDGKWDVVVNAKAKLNNKTVDVAVHHNPKDGDRAVVTARIKIADLLPGGTSIPGLTDVEFDRLDVNRDFVQVTGKIKKLDTVIAVFKRSGKTYIAINNPRPIKIDSLISAAKGTALDDATFQHMTYIWAPRGGAKTRMAPSAFPPDIAYNVKQVVTKVNLKEGLNVIGRMVIARNSKMGKMLKNVGAYKSSMPLIGNLSPKIFHPGSAGQFKNDILDHLDFKMDLPKLNVASVPKAVKFKSVHLAIKGKKVTNSQRIIDVDVGGELDVKAGSKTVAFDFDLDLKKASGGKTEIHVNGTSAPGNKLTVNLVEKMTLKDLKFSMNGTPGRLAWKVTGESTFRSKTLTVIYQSDHSLLISDNMTLAEITGHPDLPVLKDIKSGYLEILKNVIRVNMTIKGVNTSLDLWKPRGASKYYAGFSVGDFSPAAFIPGAAKSPLKDVTFKGLTFVHKPAGGRPHLSGPG